MSEVVHIQQMVALAILSFAFFALAPQGKTSTAKSSLINPQVDFCLPVLWWVWLGWRGQRNIYRHPEEGHPRL